MTHSSSRYLSSFGLLLALVLFASSAFGQTVLPTGVSSSNDTGVRALEVYSGARENVNLSNGNLNVYIPLLSLPGRNGQDLVLPFSYSSKIWQSAWGYDASGNPQYWWDPEQGPIERGLGWSSPHPWMTNARGSDGTLVCDRYVLGMPGGTMYGFHGVRTNCSDVTGHPQPQANRYIGDSDDGSAIRLNVTGIVSTPASMKDGTIINAGSAGGGIADPNGNAITYTPLQIIDNLGRVVTITTSLNTTTWTYKDSNGVVQTITFNYTQRTLTPHFTRPQALCNDGPGCTPFTMLTSIVLANNLSYTFTYNEFGELIKITYPAGGYTRYDYLALTAPNQDDDRRVSAKHVCTNANGDCTTQPELTTTYTWGSLGSGLVDVRDPEGNRTQYEYLGSSNPPQPTNTRIYQGESQLLRTIHTDFFAGFPSRTTTTFNDTNQVTKTEWDYDTYAYITGQGYIDNVIEQREFAYGNGAPGPLLRKTVNTWLKVNPINGQDYGSSAIHILNRIASRAIYDGAGNLVAQTQFEYDNYASDGSHAALQATGAVQHDPGHGTGYTYRGNLTAVKRWRNTDNVWLTTYNQYDDAGNVIKTIDPKLNTTTFSYADSWGNATCIPSGGNAAAYRTSVTDGLSHVVSSTYNSCSGTAASATDANNKITTFVYDLMNRLIETDSPDGGQTTVAFNESSSPISVTTTSKVTPTISAVRKTVADGLAREVQNQLTSDPDGATFTDITFDGLERRKTISNPYRAATDATYGITTNVYDALGRVTTLIPPDGTATTNNVSTSYQGNCSTVTDQAGKPRKSCSDALGRLIEVDEPGGGGPALPGTGSATVSGSEQSIPPPGTYATGTITVDGVEGYIPCYADDCPFYDTGFVEINVGGFVVQAEYGEGSTDLNVTQSLTSLLNNSLGSPVTASQNGTVITLTSRAPGDASNYSLTTRSWTTNTRHFSGASFHATPSGPMSGGHDPGYDSGTVWVTVTVPGGSPFTAMANYGQNSTPASVAGDIAVAFQNLASPVNASASGATVLMTAKIAAESTNQYTLSAGYATNFPAIYGSPSFTASTPRSTLWGGRDASTQSMTTPAVTLYTYDVLNNLTCVVQRDTDTSAFTTCGAAPATWRPRSFTYDSLSQLLTASNPESGNISYTYDDDGNMVSKTSPAPNQTGTSTITYQYAYDALNRLTSRSAPNQPTESYTYDTVPPSLPTGITVHNPIGRLTQTKSSTPAGDVRVISSYDVMGRVEFQIQYPNRSNSTLWKQLSYGYNPDGSLSSITYPGGRVVTYTPGAAQRPLSASDVSISFASAAHYTAAGALSSLVNGGSITSTNYYNARLQPCRMTASSAGVAPASCSDSTNLGNVLDLVYDLKIGQADNGNVYGITNKKAGARSQSFQYDPLNRLTQALTPNSANWGTNYVYDSWANLLRKAQITGYSNTDPQPGANPMTVNATNQVTAWCYDAAGNVVDPTQPCPTPPPSSYPNLYDGENRLTAATIGGVTASFDYDADGRRVKKSGATNTLYWYGPGGEVLDETDLNGALQNEYIFFGGKRTARVDSNGVHYYFSDDLGSASVITNASGSTIEEESDYYPFGGEIVVTGPGPNHYKFTGKERDPETGCDYFGARYYCNTIGRFITPDWADSPTAVPYANFGNPQSLNLYSYVRDNPISRTDLDGHNIDCSGSNAAGAGCQSIAAWNRDHEVSAREWAANNFDGYRGAQHQSGSGWTSKPPTSGDYVTVSDYPTGAGGFHHMGIAVDNDDTHGFSTSDPTTPWWKRLFGAPKGRMEDDIDQHTNTKNGEVARHSYLYLSITAAQATAIRAAIDARTLNAGRYNLLFRNCAGAIESFLHAGGVPGIPHGEVFIPAVLHDVLLLERASQ